MRKLDSVLRESVRMNGTQLGTVMRKFMVPYTFSDGMEIPKDAWVVGASSTIHRTSVYEDPDTFGGFRFSKLREEAGMGDILQLTGTSREFLAWGGGAHACPGRFYAAMLLKIILEQLLLSCKFKLKGGSERRPDNMHFEISRLPDIAAPIVFRKYKDGIRSQRLKRVIRSS